MGVLLPVAFLAGIVTAISPCVLPVLPVAMAGSVSGGRRRPVGIVAGFVVTLVAFTLALTAALEAIGLSASTQRNVGVAILIAVAATLVVPALGDRVARTLTPLTRLGSRIPTAGDGFVGGLVMGVALGLVWAPCAGPVFSAIAAATATERVGAGTWLVLSVYALGAALPMLAIMLGGQRIARRLAPRAVQIRAGMGVLLAVTGVLIFTGQDTRFTAWVIDAVPSYTDTLQAAERAPTIRDDLDRVQGRQPGASPVEREPTEAQPSGVAERSASAVELPVYGRAPELQDIAGWFNDDDTAHTLAGLRGRVVLLDFWTYSCINCIRTIPHLREWDRRYRTDGLTILGVHTPEFAFEREPANVRRAIDDLGVTWPVALDPDFGTWNAWGNRYWPAKYLIDRDGNVRAFHFGEGAYDETEDQIRTLLGESGARAVDRPETGPTGHDPQTPESYLGYVRMDRFAATPTIRPDRAQRYRAPTRLDPDELAYSGTATVRNEHVEAGTDFAIDLNFRARRVFLVLGSTTPRRARVLLDGRPIAPGIAGDDVGPDGSLTVDGDRLYRLVDLGRRGTGRLTIELAPGTRAYAFTFG